MAPAFPPAPDVSAPPPEVLIAPTAMVPEDPVAVSTVFPPAPPAPDTSAVPPDVLMEPIDIVPEVPEVVIVTEPPAWPAPVSLLAKPRVSMSPATVTAVTVVEDKELARMTVPPAPRSNGVVVMD